MRERVPVHWVARPHDRVARERDRPQHRWEQRLDLVRTHAREQDETSGLASGIETLAQADDLVGCRVGADLHADRVVDAGEELDVRAVELTRAGTEPQQVGRAVVPVAGDAVAAGERFLVPEEQGFVGSEDVDLVQLQLGIEVDPARPHELERALDLARERFVATAFRTARDELLVPGLHTREVREATLGKRAEEVQRGRRLVVRLHQARRVGTASDGVERVVVHRVATERRQGHAITGLGR